jgi:hypothetical protein
MNSFVFAGPKVHVTQVTFYKHEPVGVWLPRWETWSAFCSAVQGILIRSVFLVCECARGRNHFHLIFQLCVHGIWRVWCYLCSNPSLCKTLRLARALFYLRQQSVVAHYYNNICVVNFDGDYKFLLCFIIVIIPHFNDTRRAPLVI